MSSCCELQARDQGHSSKSHITSATAPYVLGEGEAEGGQVSHRGFTQAHIHWWALSEGLMSVASGTGSPPLAGILFGDPSRLWVFSLSVSTGVK